VGADRGYDAKDFVIECREFNITPHVAQKWMKTVGGFRRSRYRGVERTGLCGELVATAYNLVRMSRLIA